MNTNEYRIILSLVVWLITPFPATVVAEIPYATDAPKPLTPEESIESFQLPEDLRIEIVVSEPLIVEPGAMAFDEFGRLYVGELHGYNLEGYYDIHELNKTGVLDRAVRRVRVEGPNLERARNEAVGAIKLLEDEDGDGRFEKVRLWAGDLPPCYGLLRARDGLIAICPPEIIYLADLDGDGQAEFRETLFAGFRFDVLERGINSPRRGADNWIYVAAGGGGGEITGPHLAESVRIGHTDFRIRDDGSAIETVTGTGATFGLALSDFGDRFIASTNSHALYAVPLEYRHLIRNPHVASPSGKVNAADYDRIFPTSKPDPWRAARNADPNWVNFYGQRETTPNGYFTAACGPFIYRGGSLPDAYLGNHFACEPANNLVHRGLLNRDGAGYRVTRVPGEEESEFLTSTDRWFRPINLENGPDGALYIIDFYREIIEDYSAIPRHLQQRYMNSLRAGFEHGRIWRVAAKDAPAFKHTRLGEASLEDLVAALESSNPWDRETAQRLILKRDAIGDAPFLRTLFFESKSPTARLHALYTLDGLGALRATDVERALSDDSYGVRIHALRLAEPWMDTSETVHEQVLSLADDPDPAVRLQVAQSLGASSHPEAVEALASIAADFGDDRWMSAAIVSSAVAHPESLVEKLLQLSEPNPAIMDVVSPLATTVAAQGSDAKIEYLLEIAAETQGDSAPALQIAVLDGMAEGLKNNNPSAPSSMYRFEGLVQMLASTHPIVRERALRVAGLLQLGDSPVLQRAWDEAGQTALDRARPIEIRIAAVNMLSAAPWERKTSLGNLLTSQEPLDLQLAAVRVIGSANHEVVPIMLLEPYETMSPRVQEAILDALFMKEDRLASVLDAIDRGVIVPGALPPIRRFQMLESGSQAIRERAGELLQVQYESERAEIIEQFRPALVLPRNIERGRAIFVERCSVCHLLRGTGTDIGPDLSAIRTRPDDTLLSDIFDPSGVITAGFTSYIVTTRDGGLYTGTLAEETATSIILRRAEGETDTILRNQIEEMRTSSVSLMPDGLEIDLTSQDFADLLGYLRDAGGALTSAGIVVFDDEPEFPAALTEGGGSVELSAENPYSGSSCLRVTPPQRHSRRIDGWRYRVVEHPAISTQGDLEEIRYLRLAWRTEGDGVMIELADDGRWPPADAPLRRYYSGANLTDWQATQVTNIAPKDWAVITVDLWKDFGEFTLTGIAPTAMGGAAYFDRIEFLASIEAILPQADGDSITGRD